MPDLPDYTRYMTVNITVPATEQAPVIPRPKGGILQTGSLTTTSEYQQICGWVVSKGKTFNLAKSLVSCPQDVMYKWQWDGSDFGAEIYVTGGLPFPDWYPWLYFDLDGDGVKLFRLLVKFPSGGSAAVCEAEFVGEEADTEA